LADFAKRRTAAEFLKSFPHQVPAVQRSIFEELDAERRRQEAAELEQKKLLGGEPVLKWRAEASGNHRAVTKHGTIRIRFVQLESCCLDLPGQSLQKFDSVADAKDFAEGWHAAREKEVD
jgi:hypothetical protein